MKQYIDKSAVIAEIDALQDATMDENRNFLSSYHEGIFDGLSKIENFLDTLEVKEVDLEKEIKRFTMSKELYEADSAIKAVAEHFFELGMAASSKAQKGE